jgi:hypothetical protein
MKATAAATAAAGSLPMSAGSRKNKPQWPVASLPILAQARYKPLASMVPTTCPATGYHYLVSSVFRIANWVTHSLATNTVKECHLQKGYNCRDAPDIENTERLNTILFEQPFIYAVISVTRFT